MAASSEVNMKSEDDLNVLQEITREFLLKNDVQHRKVSLGRRIRDLKDGDVVLPRGCCPEVSEQIIKDLETEIKEKTSERLLPIKRLASDIYNSVVFYADRPRSFCNVIKETLIKGDNYGLSQIKSDQKTVVIKTLCCLDDDDYEPETNPELIRNIVLLQQLVKLLQASGYQVISNISEPPDCVKSLYRIFDLDVTQIDTNSCLSRLTHCEETLTQCKYREEIKHILINPDRSLDDRDKRLPVILNVRNFIQDKKLPVGKSGYDKNLCIVNVITEDGGSVEVKEACYLLQCLSAVMSNQQTLHCLHLVSQRQAFLRQQIDLLYQIISDVTNQTHCIKQSHFIYGDVTSRSLGPDNQTLQPSLSSQQLYSLRYEQMVESTMMKYGEQVTSDRWKDTLKSLTVAGLRFEMLSTTARNIVKLDLQENKDGQGLDNRAGSFVMYNCARLATLFKHYNDGVEKGFYPSLPDVDEVKFESLREEEEWTLLYNYIYIYPEMVKSCVENLGPSSSDINAKIHTHKVANFLISLSRSLSSYYSRIHILGDCQPHLLAIMFPRLYLMKAAHQVLQNGLLLMGITPPTQL
ncbi:DALR anticodon-binding domain-containing protein 3 [Patella vulgata]|uniref:DALR anticodon-binding domain-containing protein 3 n=1 Tax=Patella vulgata TaxID=6465 RepID=UPI00217F7825|nr:DALR anticodon-binding domain-containing protein 3 [Patella vulgata]